MEFSLGLVLDCGFSGSSKGDAPSLQLLSFWVSGWWE